MNTLFFLCIFLIWNNAYAQKIVVDMIELIKDPECLIKRNTNAIFRAYKSNGQIDPYVKDSLIRAKDIDCSIYIQPCFKCGSPSKQIADTCDAIYGTDYLYYPYLVIQEPELWSKDQAPNREFIKLLADEVQKLKRCFLDVRFKSTKADWEKIVGTAWTEYKSKDLWYVTNDKKKDVLDFIPFGGWETPYIKTYDQDEMYCKNNVNLNYLPKEHQLKTFIAGNNQLRHK